MDFYNPYADAELPAVAAQLRVNVRDRYLLDDVAARLEATIAVSDPEAGDVDLDEALTCAQSRRARACADAIDAAVAVAESFCDPKPKPKRKRETERQKRERRWMEAYLRRTAPPSDEPLSREIRLKINRAERAAREGRLPEVETLADRLLRD